MRTILRNSILSLLDRMHPLSGLEHDIAQSQQEESAETEDQPAEEEQVNHDHSERGSIPKHTQAKTFQRLKTN